MMCFWQGGNYGAAIEEESEESCIRQLPQEGIVLLCLIQEKPANCKYNCTAVEASWTKTV